MCYVHARSLNRAPLCCCQDARCFIARPPEACADDYANPDIKLADEPDSGATLCLAQVHDMPVIRLQLQPSKQPLIRSFETPYSRVCQDFP